MAAVFIAGGICVVAFFHELGGLLCVRRRKKSRPFLRQEFTPRTRCGDGMLHVSGNDEDVHVVVLSKDRLRVAESQKIVRLRKLIGKIGRSGCHRFMGGFSVRQTVRNSFVEEMLVVL